MRIDAPAIPQFALAVTFATLFGVFGCADSFRANQAHNISRWAEGGFAIEFHAGPRSANGKAFSYYVVSHASDCHDSREIIESAWDSSTSFGPQPPKPKDHIRLIIEPKGDRLLIEEEIPNDCSACKNYILVSRDDLGSMRHTYLRLPEESHPQGRFESELPTVKSLNGKTITYRYSFGEEISVSIDELEASSSPTAPG